MLHFGLAGNLKRLMILVLIILICTPAVASARQPFDAAPGSILRLTDDLDYQEHPSVDGELIVWNHVSEENPAIVVCNITTQEKTVIPVYNRGRQDGAQISGDHIVWTDIPDLSSDMSDQAVYLYTISTGRLSIISSEAAIPRFPVISGNYVVWEDYRKKEGHSSRDIYMYDILTEEETAICTAPLDQRGPRIQDDRVIWTDMRNGDQETYLYNITTGEEKALSADPRERARKFLGSEQAIWTDPESGELRHYDFVTRTERVISDGSSHKTGISISGDRVVWTDFAFRGSDVPDYDNHLFNLTEDREMLIYDSGYHTKGRPSISGDYIVWAEVGDIWLFRYEPGGSPPPAWDTPGFSATIASLSLCLLLPAWRRIIKRV